MAIITEQLPNIVGATTTEDGRATMDGRALVEEGLQLLQHGMAAAADLELAATLFKRAMGLGSLDGQALFARLT